MLVKVFSHKYRITISKLLRIIVIIVSIEVIEGLRLQMARLLTPPTSSLRKVLGDIKHHYVFHLNHQNLILWLQKYLHIGYISLIIPIYSYLTNMTITTIDLFYFDNNIKT